MSEISRVPQRNSYLTPSLNSISILRGSHTPDLMEVFILKNWVQMWTNPSHSNSLLPSSGINTASVWEFVSLDFWNLVFSNSKDNQVKKEEIMKKKYQLDWLPFWSSQGLGPRNPIWEGRREGGGKMRERGKQRWKREIKREERSYHSVNKCAASSVLILFTFYTRGCAKEDMQPVHSIVLGQAKTEMALHF